MMKSTRNNAFKLGLGGGEHRRTFLRRLGLGAAASVLAPILPIFNATGQETTGSPLRLVLWTGTDGMSANWDSHTAGLFAGRVDPADIIVVRGIQGTWGEHGDGHIRSGSSQWTASNTNPPGTNGVSFKDPDSNGSSGWGQHASIDRYVAQNIASYQETAFAAVAFGVLTDEPHSRRRTIYEGDNAPVHPETNPLAAFNRLFDEGTAAPTPSADPEALKAQLRLQLSSLSVLSDAAVKLKSRLAVQEHYKLEQQVTAYQEMATRLEERLARGPALAACAQNGEINYVNTTDAVEGTDLFIELIVSAFACDRTRIASHQMLHTQMKGAAFGHGYVHGASHGGNLDNVDEFNIEKMGVLIDKLKNTPDGEGSLYDNTLIVYSKDMENGDHGNGNIPFVLAGGAAGRISTGRTINADSNQAGMLTTIGRIMGLDINTFGNLSDEGPIQELLEV